MSRLAARLIILLALAAGARSQEPAPDAPWDRPEARAEARRVLERSLEVLRRTERRDARDAAEALRDPSWLLRALALSRLRVLGLDAATLEALAPHCGPAGAVPEGEWPAGEAARAFARALPAAPPAPGPPVGAPDALRTLVATALDRIESGPEEPSRKRDMADALLPLRAVVPAPERAWLAEALLGLVQARDVLADLGASDLATARGEDGAPLLRWWIQNRPYLSWSKKARRFLLDREARSAGVPTAEHRRGRPWPPE